MPEPIFGRKVNPIPTGKGRLSPPITTGTPNVFHLPASLPLNKLPWRKDKLLEVDKEWFQIQIRSLEEKLERRNDRAKNLEVSNKEYQDRFVNFF